MCYAARPPRGTMLYALEIPELFSLMLGDTEFASTTAAWDALPERVRRHLDGRRAVFHFAGRKRAFPPTQAEIDRYPPVTHPIVRTHPDTGRKCLYVMRDDCTGIEGTGGQDRGADRRTCRSYCQAGLHLSPPMAGLGPLDVGQLHGAAPGDPGLRPAATPADAPNDHGRRGSDVEDEAIITLVYAPHACSLTSHITLEEAVEFSH